MMIKWENRKSLKELKVTVKVDKYFADIITFYKSYEECNDRGLRFFDDVITHKIERIELREAKYKTLSEGCDYRGSVVNGYMDKVNKLYITKHDKEVSLILEVDVLIQNKKYKQAIKYLEEAKAIISNQFTSYNNIFKDEFIDKWNQAVQEDLDTIESKIQIIQDIQLQNGVEKKARKLNKIKKAYAKLLEEKPKYSDTYFAQLENKFFDEHQITKEVLIKE